MDRRRALLIATLLAVGACARDVAAGPADFNELRWLAEGADPVAALTKAPAGCVKTPADPSAARRVRLGELAFGSSALLGGQAARAGLSCASCHRNGRGNPDFVFPGLSGAPGTADVTSGFFGPDRADETVNPVKIPDLGDEADRDFLKTATADDAAQFVRAQVIEEFEAKAPSDAVLAGLGAYLAAIDAGACGDAAEAITWRDDFEDALAAAGFAQDAEAAGDQATATMMQRTARLALGRLHERFPQEEIRSALVDESAALAKADDADAFGAWLARASDLERQLARHARRSFYDPKPLRAALDAADG